MDREERKRVLHEADFGISQVDAQECALCSTEIKQALESGPQGDVGYLQCYVYFEFINLFSVLVLSLIEIPEFPRVPSDLISISLCV